MMKAPVLAIVSLVVVLVTAYPAQAGTNILFIFDASNSMWGQIDGVAKIETARDALNEALEALDVGINVGLMVYGHRRSGDCDDIELLSGIGTEEAAGLRHAVDGITPRGKTPLAGSLAASEVAFHGREEGNNTVVLISDGIETCGGDPCAIAANLAEKGINVRIHTVGFDVDEGAQQQLMCIAEAGGGQYFRAENPGALRLAMSEVRELVQADIEVEPEPQAVPEPQRAVYFHDDFEGVDLGDAWELLNPDPSAYIVENGQLMMINSGGIKGFQNPDTPNIVRLDQSLPDGDWDLIVKLRGELKTGNDSVWFGLYTDQDNFMGGHLWSEVACCGCSNTGLTLVRQAAGQETKFDRFIRGAGRCSGWNPEPMSAFLDELAGSQLTLTFSKRGREYRAAFQFDGEQDDEGMPIIYQTETLTSLRPPGGVALAIGQWKAAQGETLIFIDSITVETVTE